MKHLTKQGKLVDGKVVGGINWVKTIRLDGTERYGYTWNPLGWGCEYGCPFCYARKLANRQLTKCEKCNTFVPHFHPERVDAPLQLKEPSKIFPCDMSDLFGRGIEEDWQSTIFGVIEQTQHTYLTLTKQGIGTKTRLPTNLWFGVSCHSQAMVKEATRILRYANATHKWVSFEPLLGPVFAPDLLDLADWVVIGALSRGKDKVQPPAKAVENILDGCERRNIPVWFKNNLEWTPFREEFPR